MNGDWCETYLWNEEDQVGWLGLAQLSKVVKVAWCEELSEVWGEFEEHVDLVSMLNGDVSLTETLDLLLELSLV